MPSTRADLPGGGGRTADAPLGAARLPGGEGEVAAVAVHVLAEQGDLGDAERRRPRVTSSTMSAKRTADLLAAHGGHDAEGAAVVAADLDRDPPRPRHLAPHRQRRGERVVVARPRSPRGSPRSTGPGRAASWSSSAARCTLWVPSTTSTYGARSVTVSRSFWARQPATTICMPGWRSFTDLRWPRVPYSLLSAFSRMQHVLRTTTSASSAVPVSTSPSACSRPAMRSESCSFIWHPKVRRKKRRGSVTPTGYRRPGGPPAGSA